MIDAITPLDYHLDVIVARLKATLYVLAHPSTRGYEEFEYWVDRTGREREVVRFVGVIRGSILDGSVETVKAYFGRPRFPLDACR